MLHTRFTLWRLFIVFLAFASSLQCLDAAVIKARPRQRAPATKGAKTSSRSPSPAGGLGTPLPRPEVYLQGQFVGIRVKSYESGSKNDIMHPGVVVGGPTGDREYRVAMISSKLPGNPPQKPVSTYKPGMEGNISLSPVAAAWAKMKPWKQKNSGSNEPASALEAKMLKNQVATFSAS